MFKSGKWIACVLAFLLALSGLVLPNDAAADSAVGKIINVVYDDSRSMYLNNETRWCQAKYAMEVFCAMMGENDVMNIYAMNRADILTLNGSDPARVEKVHAMTSKYSGTPFSTVTAAGNALKNADRSMERWLVVLTDGSFDNTSQAVVQSTLDGYNSDGIKTVYLAIGNDAVELQGDASRGAYAEKAVNTADILSKVTSIANQIFEHQVLGSKFVSSSGGMTFLNIDVPTDQIIVFAQGEGATVGSLSLNGETITATSAQSVKHSGDVMPLNNEEIQVDTSLHGVVAKFEAGSTPFQSGQFSVAVSNATTVEYYYRPGVTVNCELRYNGKPVKASDELYAGEYEVALSFVDPLTGKTIESELLSSAVFTLTVTNNGETQVVTEKRGTVTLAEGDVNIYAVAELPGNVSLSSSKSYTVLPEPIDLLLKFDPGKQTYAADALGENAVPILLSITNAETGAALTEAEWDATELIIEEAGGVKWNVRKGTETGTWELRPESKDGTLAGVMAGDYRFVVSASYQIGGQYAFGSGELPVTLEAYAGSALKIDISAPTEKYDLNDMSEPESMLVTVQYEDAVSGEFKPLTEEMWNSFSLKASSEKRMGWSLKKGDTVGTWLLMPGHYANDPLLSDSGTITVNVEAEGTSGEYTYAGIGSEDVEFEPLSMTNLLKELLPRILLAAFLIWLIVGYIKKKRLRTRGLNPRCRFKDTVSPRQRISKDFLSVILPYVSEKATVRCHKSAFQCNFPDLRIQAVGRRSFKIINKTMPLKTTKICGEFYSDMQTLQKRNFSFGNFDITTVNPKANNRNMGTFSFN